MPHLHTWVAANPSGGKGALYLNLYTQQTILLGLRYK